MVGVPFGPYGERNFTACRQQQRSAFGVQRPVTLTGHPPTVVEVTAAHVGDQFVEFARQTLFFAQPGQVANVIDQHPAVYGHGPSDCGVFREGPYHGGQVPSEQAFNSVGSGFQSLSVGLVDKGLGNQFSKSTQACERVGGGHVSNLLFRFECFKRMFGIRPTENHVFFVGLREVANDASSADDSMAHRSFSASGVGGNRSVCKGLQNAVLHTDGLVDRRSVGQFKHRASPRVLGLWPVEGVRGPWRGATVLCSLLHPTAWRFCRA